MNHRLFLEKILKSASQIAKERFGKVSGKEKADDPNQILTETDIEIGKFLGEEIRKEFPEHNLIDEELGVLDNGSEFTWTVDPIDGTSNFANGVPMYGIMLGLLRGSIPIAGGISLPEFSKILVAEKGKGAFANDQKVYVTKETNLRQVLVSYGIDGHPENLSLSEEEGRFVGKLVPKIRNLRASNSVFDTVMVAEGNYGAMMNKTSRIWDNVGEQVIIEEAGGVFTDFEGKSIDFSKPLLRAKDNFMRIAGAPVIHQKIVEFIKSSS